jgi:hypothetical protein
MAELAPVGVELAGKCGNPESAELGQLVMIATIFPSTEAPAVHRGAPRKKEGGAAWIY